MLYRFQKLTGPLFNLIFIALFTVSCGSWRGSDPGNTVSTGTVITVYGRVTDNSGKPLFLKPYIWQRDESYAIMTGATVSIYNSSGTLLARTTSDSNGNYSLNTIAGTNYMLKATNGTTTVKALVASAMSQVVNADITPHTTTVAQVIGQMLGNASMGDDGVNVSTAIVGLTISTAVSAIESNTNTAALTIAIFDSTLDEASLRELIATEVATEIGFTLVGLTTFSIGGTVTGLSGTVVLQNNSGDDLTITEDGTFTFATTLAGAATYAVTVGTQPAEETCTIESGNGMITSANITAITVTCATVSTYTIGGTLSGLSGTVLLLNNGGDNLNLTANGSFTFATAIVDTNTYAVTVGTQPSGEACTVTSGSGTLAGINVTDVLVTCAAGSTYTIGGTVSGLSGTLVVQNNGGNDLGITASGAFTFSSEIAGGAAYAVTISTQSSGQICTVASGSGTVAAVNVTTITISCVNTYTIGGTLSGISGTVVLQNNGGDNLIRSASGAFTFATEMTDGAAYAVTVATQPSGQTCTITSGTGTIATANIATVTISCI